MQKYILFLVSLTLICYCVEPSPVGLGTQNFDNLDTDLDSLAYEVEEEDLDDFAKLLDEQDSSNAAAADDKFKSVQTSGFKSKNTENKRKKSKHNIQDLKKFYKAAGEHDQGAYDDDDVYASIEAAAEQAVRLKGNEDRTYRKGTKTRGYHRVHHKDEYKKDKTIYEDDETKGTIKKVGAKGLGYKIGAGASFNKGHYHHDRLKGAFGKKGYLDKGFSEKEINGYSDSQGFEGSFDSTI